MHSPNMHAVGQAKDSPLLGSPNGYIIPEKGALGSCSVLALSDLSIAFFLGTLLPPGEKISTLIGNKGALANRIALSRMTHLRGRQAEATPDPGSYHGE